MNHPGLYHGNESLEDNEGAFINKVFNNLKPYRRENELRDLI